MSNVVPISAAKSFAAPSEDRFVDLATFCHYFGISPAAAKNWAKGYYFRSGKRVHYKRGPMPHGKTPGGHLRFNLAQCKEWLNTGETPV